MNIEWETLTAWGRVTKTFEKDGLGIVECETGIRNDSGLETHAEYEENLLNKVHHTEDAKEGRLAFREKRQPVFKGR